ncbi:MAG: hypothetical protein JXB62_03370 [Pirellulales bacterium]|nr:hypothetical protein [Pirellulales bacterium]
MRPWTALRILLTWVILLLPLSRGASVQPLLRYPQRPDIPLRWQNTRAFYCPLANSGPDPPAE